MNIRQELNAKGNQDTNPVIVYVLCEIDKTETKIWGMFETPKSAWKVKSIKEKQAIEQGQFKHFEIYKRAIYKDSYLKNIFEKK